MPISASWSSNSVFQLGLDITYLLFASQGGDFGMVTGKRRKSNIGSGDELQNTDPWCR